MYKKIFKAVPEIDNVIIGLFVGNDTLQAANPPDGRLQVGNEANAHRFTMNRRLTAGLKNAGVEVLDLTEPVLSHQRATGERLYYTYDSHWNPAGHALAAQQIAAVLHPTTRPSVNPAD